MSITGPSPDIYSKVGVPIGDIGAGLYGVIGVLAALREISKTGRGMHVKTSLFSSLISWNTYQLANAYLKKENPVPMGTAHPNIVPYQSFNRKNGAGISIAV